MRWNQMNILELDFYESSALSNKNITVYDIYFKFIRLRVTVGNFQGII